MCFYQLLLHFNVNELDVFAALSAHEMISLKEQQSNVKHTKATGKR